MHGSDWALIKNIQSKGLYIIYEYILSLEGAIHDSLQVQDIVVLDTDWPVQHWSCVCVCAHVRARERACVGMCVNNKTLIIIKY